MNTFIIRASRGIFKRYFQGLAEHCNGSSKCNECNIKTVDRYRWTRVCSMKSNNQSRNVYPLNQHPLLSEYLLYAQKLKEINAIIASMEDTFKNLDIIGLDETDPEHVKALIDYHASLKALHIVRIKADKRCCAIHNMLNELRQKIIDETLANQKVLTIVESLDKIPDYSSTEWKAEFDRLLGKTENE